MLEGLYSAAAGMSAQQTQLDTIANDLANASTTGYESERVGFQDLLYNQVKQAGTSTTTGAGAVASVIGRDGAQGSLQQTGRPLDLSVRYSKHRCPSCRHCFGADLSDLAPPGSHYTHRVITVAVRSVVEDGLPYRTASWHLWRDHRVFVPYATIQNWVEAAGKKSRLAG